MVVRRTERVRRFDTKAALLDAGSAVNALTYERASQDKKEQGKSVGDQRELNVAEVDRHGWSLAGSYVDNDRSASRHAKRARPDFERLMEDIQAGKGDVLVLWEIARGQRDLAVYVKIRDLCVEVGMNFWLVGGQLYDVRDRNDRMMLGMFAVQAEFQADYIRDNVLRGMAGSASKGRPHGKVTYGFRRVYDQRTRAFLRQEPDTEQRQAVAEDGTVTEYTRAGVVRRIFENVAGGVALIVIERGLNAQGIPSPEGARWRRGSIRKQVLNPAYIGKRVYQGQVVGDGLWEGLVTDELFYACARLLGEPSRTTTRPGRAKHLLSYLIRCGGCGGDVQYSPEASKSFRVYRCLSKGCAAVDADPLDEYVSRTVVAWLSRPDVAEVLAAGAVDDKATAHARAEASRLRAELEQWRKLAETGQVSAVSFARAEVGLLQQISAYDGQVAEAGIAPVLRGRFGEQAVAAWAELEDQVAVKREIIRAVAEIRITPATGRQRRTLHPDRVQWQWKYGDQPAADQGQHDSSEAA